MYGKRPQPDEVASVDVGDRVREAAGSSATVHGNAGGLEIKITDLAAFPWAAIFTILADASQDVWVRRAEGQMIIRSKPPNI